MKQLYYIFAIILITATSFSYPEKGIIPKAYYISNTGNNQNDGSKNNPWKSFSNENQLLLQAGDTIYLIGGEVFNESFLINSLLSGTKEKPIVITSYGTIPAKITSGNSGGFYVNNSGYLKIAHIDFIGSGRKQGNTQDGVKLSNCKYISVSNLNIEGYQKGGLHIQSSTNVILDSIYAHNNGYAGILVSGKHGRKDLSNNIIIRNCIAENNPGDPTIFDNHSGNGILVGNCKNVTIEYCVATNNGWDMPRKGNGPVGIWAYESDSIIIQYCISYRNKTSEGSADGGGFDLDGGVTNSIIQYCLSYENEGSGFGLFQYDGASPWRNNTVRYCISENDGKVSAARAGIFVWNSSNDKNQLKDCHVYNNTIYNNQGAAISYEPQSDNSGFHFYNNIFVAKDELITGKESTGIFLSNNWYSLSPKGFNINGIRNLEAWAKQYNKEQLNGKIIGLNIKPKFKKSGNTTLTDPLKLSTFDSYQLIGGSQLRNSGLDLALQFGIETASLDFNKKPILKNGIGACQ